MLAQANYGYRFEIAWMHAVAMFRTRRPYVSGRCTYCVVYFVLQRCFEQSQCFLLGSEQAKLVVAEDVLMSVIGDMLE